jgi:hypothetical protein
MISRTIFFKVIFIGLVIILFSCNKSEEKAAYENMAISDSVASEAMLSSNAAVEAGIDPSRKFIRTADLKFKVKNVAASTYRIEEITSVFGGFVTYTHLSSNIDHHQIDQISADSSLESTYFTVVNNIILRIPNSNLDSSLISIAKMVDYLDYRTIKADDIRLQILSNELTIQRLSKHEKRLRGAIEDRGKKLRETGLAEENLLYKKETEDNATISNLALMDQVNYSTINLSIYQRQEVKRELIANDKNIESYEPGFVKKLLDSLKDGWKIMESLILFMVQFWGLILFGLGLFMLYKKFGHRIKK